MNRPSVWGVLLAIGIMFIASGRLRRGIEAIG